MKTRTQLDDEYNAAIETFRAASRAHRIVKEQYHARIVDDAEFIASLNKFRSADTAHDIAERAYIDAVNAMEGA